MENTYHVIFSGFTAIKVACYIIRAECEYDALRLACVEYFQREIVPLKIVENLEDWWVYRSCSKITKTNDAGVKAWFASINSAVDAYIVEAY